VELFARRIERVDSPRSVTLMRSLFELLARGESEPCPAGRCGPARPSWAGLIRQQHLHIECARGRGTRHSFGPSSRTSWRRDRGRGSRRCSPAGTRFALAKSTQPAAAQREAVASVPYASLVANHSPNVRVMTPELSRVRQRADGIERCDGKRNGVSCTVIRPRRALAARSSRRADVLRLQVTDCRGRC